MLGQLLPRFLAFLNRKACSKRPRNGKASGMNSCGYSLWATEPEEFRNWLCIEFARRRKDNPRYSLRAFAAALKTDHSTLSQIIRGRRTLTKKAMVQLRCHLDWTADMRSLLSFASLPGFSPDLRRCAERLGISRDAAAIALQRLVRRSRLAMEGNKWVPL
jgi:hypothetical protein